MFDLAFEEFAYFHLLDQLIEKFLNIKDFDRALLTPEQRAVFATEINTTIDWNDVPVDRTYRNYFKEFKPKIYFKNQLAAVWLHYFESIDLDIIQAHFKGKRKNKNRFWDSYLENLWEKIKFEKRLEEEAEMRAKLAAIPFAVPKFEDVFTRTKYINSLLEIQNGHKLIVVSGEKGTGKTFLLSDFAQKLMAIGTYAKILWKSCDPNYTLNTLLQEFEEEVAPLKSLVPFRKSLDALSYLQHHRYLLILDGFDKAIQSSFTSFFDTLSTMFGDTAVMIGLNGPDKFKFLSEDCRIQVSGFDAMEVSAFLQMQNIKVTPYLIQQIPQETFGLPYFVKLYLKDVITAEKFEENFQNSLKPISMKTRVEATVADLTEEEKRLLDALCVYDESFSRETMLFFCSRLYIGFADNHINRIFQKKAIYTIGNAQLQIEAPLKEFLQNEIMEKDRLSYHETSAACLLEGLSWNRSDVLDVAKVKRIYRAILHYQHAGNFRRANDCLKTHIPQFKRLVLYDDLDVLLTNQRKMQTKVEHERYYYDIWHDWHLAHKDFITGNFAEGYGFLIQCVNTAFDFNRYDLRDKDLVPFFLKTFQLFAEYLEVMGYADDAKAILVNTLAVFDARDLEWNARLHAISILSAFYANDGDFEKALEINFNILQDALMLTKQSIAVAHNRIGIIYCKLGDFERALEHLTVACEQFEAFGDHRGLPWALRYLCECRIRLGMEGTEEKIQLVIEISAAANLYDPAYYEWLLFIQSKVNQVAITTELARVQQIRYKIEQLTLNDNLLEKTVRAISALKTRMTVPFSYKRYTKPFENNALKVNSVSVQSFIVKVQKVAVPYLTALFERKSFAEIFAYHLNNAVIKDCAKLPDVGPIIAEKFIIPYLDYIKYEMPDNRDSIRHLYARALQSAGATMAAFEVLEVIKEENYRHDFYNIKGNCYRNLNDFESGYNNYHIALSLPNTYDRDKGRIYNNLATLVLQCGGEARYEEGINYCLEALSFRKDKDFKVYPIKTHLLLRTALTPVEDLHKTITPLIEKYTIRNRELSGIITDIADDAKKEVLTALCLRKGQS